jgi:hypothetical protein
VEDKPLEMCMDVPFETSQVNYSSDRVEWRRIIAVDMLSWFDEGW